MQSYSDAALESSVSRMLRIGVSVSAAVVFAGGVMLLRQQSIAPAGYRVFHLEGPAFRLFPDILLGSWHGEAGSIVQLGMLLLIATPVGRVILCIIGFARQRDATYIAISSAVLLILIYSLTRGGR